MTSILTYDPFTDAHSGPINLHGPHFVGIGGVAMSGLARLCVARGSAVSGSDSTDTPRRASLRAAGCRINIGHNPAHIRGATCVVYTALPGGTPAPRWSPAAWAVCPSSSAPKSSTPWPTTAA